MIMEIGVRNVGDNPGLLMAFVDLSGVSTVQVKKCSILFFLLASLTGFSCHPRVWPHV